jgi:antitoxin HigA-1
VKELGPEQLVEGIVPGDRAAEAALVQRFAPSVTVMLRARTRGGSAVPDLVQDVLLAVLQALRAGTLRDPLKLAPFVHGVTRNVANGYLRTPCEPAVRGAADRRPARRRARGSGKRETRMLPTHRPPTHPGEMLLREFLEPLGVSQVEAQRIRVSFQRLNGIVKARRAVSADTAILLEALTGWDAQIWLTLQAKWDLWHALRARAHRPRVKPLRAALGHVRKDPCGTMTGSRDLSTRTLKGYGRD